jgi:hypothetical protein
MPFGFDVMKNMYAYRLLRADTGLRASMGRSHLLDASTAYPTYLTTSTATLCCFDMDNLRIILPVNVLIRGL